MGKPYQVFQTLIKLKPLCLGVWERQYFDKDSFDGLFTSCRVVLSTHRKRFNDGVTIGCRPLVDRSLLFDSRGDRTLLPIIHHHCIKETVAKITSSYNSDAQTVFLNTQRSVHVCVCTYAAGSGSMCRVDGASFLVASVVNSGISDLDHRRMEEIFMSNKSRFLYYRYLTFLGTSYRRYMRPNTLYFNKTLTPPSPHTHSLPETSRWRRYYN